MEYYPTVKQRKKREETPWTDKTETLNAEQYWIDREKFSRDFINFCGYKRDIYDIQPGSTKICKDENDEKYISIKLKTWDCPRFCEDWKTIMTERNELSLNNENDFNFNENYKYNFSFKIPENFPLSTTRLIIWQRKYKEINDNEEKSPNPMISQRIQKFNWEYYLIVTDWVEEHNILWKKIPLDKIKGKRVDMNYEINFSDKTDRKGKPIPCTIKIKANIQWEWEINIYDWPFDLEKKNNLEFNPQKAHHWYFKFWLYRDNYEFAIQKYNKKLEEIENDNSLSEERKNKRKEKINQAINEINLALNNENEQPMEILFKNFSMENISYKERKNERYKSKNNNSGTIIRLKSKLNGDIKDLKSALQQPYNIQEEVDWERDDEIEHVEGLILRNDIEWILKYLWLDKNMVSKWLQIKTINFIGVNLLDELESITSPKDIFNDISEYKNDLKFLEGEKDIINETQNEYNKLYNKLIEIKEWKDDLQDYIFINLIKKVFKNLKRLKNSNKISRYLLYKKITKDIVELKYALRVKRKDVTKYLKRLNEYEKWEYIDFPNWITFELWKWPEKIYWTNINIWENEFYIKTDIGKNWRNKKTKYIEYVDSLKKARKLFEKKWIKLKYCQRCTWLANREFIEAYEKERQKRKAKEWIAYEKTNRLKVLEQTEDAVISYRHSTEWKSPIRFIDKDENRDLFEFAQKNKYFGEAEMWLDLDKL